MVPLDNKYPWERCIWRRDRKRAHDTGSRLGCSVFPRSCRAWTEVSCGRHTLWSAAPALGHPSVPHAQMSSILRILPKILNHLKGLFTNFEYITFFSCPTERNILLYISYITRTDFAHPFFSINSSQSDFIEMGPFTKNVSFGGARKKCYIFKIGEQSL